jgi:hypothetical protein
VRSGLPCLPNNENPTRDKEKSPNGSHGTQPCDAGKGQKVETPGKEDHSESPAEKASAATGYALSDPEKSHGMDEVIKNSRAPDLPCMMSLKKRLEGMGSEGSQ